jgi:hypothetical protein
VFDSQVMAPLAGKWWNGRWGRLAKRDIWLYQHKGWLVRWRTGDSDSPTDEKHFTDEADARAWVDHLMATGGDGWRDMTDLYSNRN